MIAARVRLLLTAYMGTGRRRTADQPRVDIDRFFGLRRDFGYVLRQRATLAYGPHRWLPSRRPCPQGKASSPPQIRNPQSAIRPASAYWPATAAAMRPAWGESCPQRLGSAACLSPIASPLVSCRRSRARCRGRRNACCWYPPRARSGRRRGHRCAR